MEVIENCNKYRTPLSYFRIPATDVPALRVSLKQQLLPLRISFERCRPLPFPLRHTQHRTREHPNYAQEEDVPRAV